MKPTIGQANWGNVLNSHLDEMAADTATRAERDYTMTSADADTPARVIRQPNTVGPSSVELFQVFLDTLKTFWFNEGGCPRAEAYDVDQVALKLFARRTGTASDQQANIQEWFDAAGVIVSRVSPLGIVMGPNQVRAVQATEPATASWLENELWLDTSTEV